MEKEKEFSIIQDIENSSGYKELAEIFKSVEQTQDIVKAAIEKNGLMLEFVKVPSPEICMLAVKEDGGALKFVKEQTPEICLEAVKTDGMALKYVKEQTQDIIDAAISQNEFSYGFINIESLKEEKTEKQEEQAGKSIEKQSVSVEEKVDTEAFFNTGKMSADYEDYLKAMKEADEAFWASIQAVRNEDSQFVGGDEIDFSKLEDAERKANEAAYQIQQMREREKKQKEEWEKNRNISFTDLEEAQRKVDEIFLEMYLSENSKLMGKEVSKILNNEELPSEKSVGDATMDQILKKYIDYSRSQGVPEDVITLMKQPNISLSQMMQIKFGYEDGLSTPEISQYAKAEMHRNDMVIARYNLLRAREMGIEQAVNTIAEPKKKTGLDERIAKGSKTVSNIDVVKENSVNKNLEDKNAVYSPKTKSSSRNMADKQKKKDNLDKKIASVSNKALDDNNKKKKETCKQSDKELCL